MMICVAMLLGAHELLGAGRGHRRHHRPDVFRTYDENHDGKLDKGERAKIRRDLNEDERLEKYDKDGDRKLSDEEIDAIRPTTGKRKAKAGPGKS